MTIQFLTAKQAVTLINTEDKVIFGGFIGAVVPEAIERELGLRYQRTGQPRNLDIYFAAGQGDSKDKALNHIAQKGLIRRAVGGHWGLIPKLQKLAAENDIEGYNLPQGVMCHLMRDSAAGKPGVLTHVGLGTFIDPREEGGKINTITTEDIVHLQEIHGKEQLFYDRIDANVAVIRGTTADSNGNISMEDECLYLENLAAATLVHNQGGTVIVQVKNVVKSGRLSPHSIRIPSILVDVVVQAKDDGDHMQTFGEQMNETFVGRGIQTQKPTTSHPLDIKKIIARRSALELKKGAVINYGIGVPEIIAEVTDEEGVTMQLTATVEPGAIGGTPAGGLSFGASAFPEAIITQDQMFDFYDGGGIDQAFLGLAQADRKGDLNVSRFGTKIAGCGGFINITQNAKQVFFCGSFTAGKSIIFVKDGKLIIEQDGIINKFINKVQQITFSADVARYNNKKVLYITERAVFNLAKEGLELIEIAPNVNIEKDILSHMEFKPIISKNIKEMDARIFKDKPMGLILE